MKLLLAAMAAQALAGDLVLEGGDPAKGRDMYKKQCAVCHGQDTSRPGHAAPMLAGVVGRKAGAIPDFTYSPAMTAYGQIWSVESLDRYLAEPKVEVPKGWMKFPGIPDKYDRADLIAYLREISER